MCGETEGNKSQIGSPAVYLDSHIKILTSNKLSDPAPPHDLNIRAVGNELINLGLDCGSILVRSECNQFIVRAGRKRTIEIDLIEAI